MQKNNIPNTTLELKDISEKIVKYCIENDLKFIYISGNGGSGKTELGKMLFDLVNTHGNANLINTDDFLVNTTLRNSANALWNDIEGVEKSGRYTSSHPDSYYLPSLKAIIFNIKNGNDYYHLPRKAVSTSEAVLMHDDAKITIVEGVGSAFLGIDDEESLRIYMKCTGEVEVSRRVGRGLYSNEKSEEDVLKNFEDRDSQFRAFVEPLMDKFGLVIESNEDYSLSIIKDSYNLVR